MVEPPPPIGAVGEGPGTGIDCPGNGVATPEVTAHDIIAFEEDALGRLNEELSDGAVPVSIPEKLLSVEQLVVGELRSDAA